MRTKYLLFTLLLGACSLGTHGMYAQPINEFHNIGVHRAKLKYQPKVVLVQLRSENRKIEYVTKHNPNLLPRIKKEAAKIREVTINDFKDRFTFCPVYYFIDTNADLIKERKFAGVLLDTAGKPVSNPIRNPLDTNYVIVYYGYPNHSLPAPGTPAYNHENAPKDAMGKGLIILDYKYRQIDYYYRLEYWLLFSPPNRKYGFNSKKYDMDYFPFARWYNRALMVNFGSAENNSDK